MSSRKEFRLPTSSQDQSLLIQLPPELRTIILRYALIRDTPIRSDSNGKCYDCPNSSCRFSVPRIFELCQKLYFEANEFFFAENTFVIDIREGLGGSLVIAVAGKRIVFNPASTYISGRHVNLSPLESHAELNSSISSIQPPSIDTLLGKFSRTSKFVLTFHAAQISLDHIEHQNIFLTCLASQVPPTKFGHQNTFLACLTLSDLLDKKNVEVKIVLFQPTPGEDLSMNRDLKRVISLQTQCILSALPILRCHSVRINMSGDIRSRSAAMRYRYRRLARQTEQLLQNDISATTSRIEEDTPHPDLFEKWFKFLRRPINTVPGMGDDTLRIEVSRNGFMPSHTQIYHAIVTSDVGKFEYALEQLRMRCNLWHETQRARAKSLSRSYPA